VLCNVIFRRVGLPYGERVSAMHCKFSAGRGERVSAKQRNFSAGRPSLWRENKFYAM
jgi:hypothetical protein